MRSLGQQVASRGVLRPKASFTTHKGFFVVVAKVSIGRTDVTNFMHEYDVNSIKLSVGKHEINASSR